MLHVAYVIAITSLMVEEILVVVLTSRVERSVLSHYISRGFVWHFPYTHHNDHKSSSLTGVKQCCRHSPVQYSCCLVVNFVKPILSLGLSGTHWHVRRSGSKGLSWRLAEPSTECTQRQRLMWVSLSGCSTIWMPITLTIHLPSTTGSDTET